MEMETQIKNGIGIRKVHVTMGVGMATFYVCQNSRP